MGNKGSMESAPTARFRSRVEPPDRIRPQINSARVLRGRISFCGTAYAHACRACVLEG